MIKRNDLRCAPNNKLINGTCYSIEQLRNIANDFNKNNYDKIIFDNNTSKKRLLYRLIIKLSKYTNCDNQLCWLNILEDDELKKNILNNTFRPIGPANKGNNKWLSNFDINAVMKQYENLYKDFLFLGSFPVDFYEIGYIKFKHDIQYNTSLNKKNIIDLDKLYNTTYKLGIIINLDKHNQSGSHWVSLFINLKTRNIFYSDSGSNKPPNYINNFIKSISIYLKSKEQKKINYKINKKKIQFGNSECGLFSINFILNLLKNENIDDYFENPPNDSEVNECRDVYFIDENKF